MATIVLRNVKGSPLTNVELDANFSNLNNDKVEKSTLVSTGDGLVGGGDLSTNRTLALATSGVTAGSYGANNSIPAFTLDSYGRVTAASTITPSGTWAISVTGNAGTASSVGWAGVTGKPTTLSGYGITDGQTTLVSGTSIKTVNGQSVLGSGNIQIDGGVVSFNTRTGAITLTSGDVTTALGFTPENAANKGAANGIAPLGADSKVPAAYLPSYVDDVLEYANTAGFPAIGETAKIYVALDTNKTYRWSGSAYVEISPSPGTTDSLTEGATNLYFTTARARAALSATGAVSYNAATGVISAELTSGYASKTISSNTTLVANTEYETGSNLRVNHTVSLVIPASTKLIVREYAAGLSL